MLNVLLTHVCTFHKVNETYIPQNRAEALRVILVYTIVTSIFEKVTCSLDK